MPEGLTFIDIIVAVAIGFGFIRGWMNGFIKEIAGLVGIILGLWAGLRLAWVFADYYRENFEVPETVIPFIAFLTAFLLVLLAVVLIGRLLRKILEKAALSGFDKLAGALFGGLKLAFLIGTLVGMVGKAGFLPDDTKERSLSYPYLVIFTEGVTDYTIGLIPSVKNSFKDMDEYFDGLRGIEPSEGGADDSSDETEPSIVPETESSGSSDDS